MKKGKVLNIVAWVLQVLMGLQMLVAGQSKFTTPANWETRFRDWGYFDNFFYLIGALEVIAAIMLFIPKTIRYGTMIIMPVMLGAIATHIIHGENFLGAGIPFVFALTVFYLRRPAAGTSKS